MSDTTITSPVGAIQFLALRKSVCSKMNATAEEKADPKLQAFTMRLEFDGSTKEGSTFRKQIESINPGIIGTKHATGSNFTVGAKSKFAPKVVDSSGNYIAQEDLPSFNKGSTGTAKMLVTPYTGNALGGSINLTHVQLFDLELVDLPEFDPEEQKAKLKAALAKTASPK